MLIQGIHQEKQVVISKLIFTSFAKAMGNKLEKIKLKKSHNLDE